MAGYWEIAAHSAYSTFSKYEGCPESFETVSVSQSHYMLYNKIHTDEQINVLCGTVENNRVEK